MPLTLKILLPELACMVGKKDGGGGQRGEVVAEL